MRLVFRADASQDIGSGHVMRCLAIAEEAISHGIECIFVGRIQNVAWLENRVRALGFSNIVEQGLFTPKHKSDSLIIDSYTLERNDSFLSTSNWKKTIAIVDEATPFYATDMYIHPGFYADWFQGDRSKLLAGSQYIPFRKSIKKIEIKTHQKLSKLIIFGGGTDVHNFGFEISKILTHFNNFDSAVFFSKHRSVIENIDSRFKVLDFGDLLDTEIETSDLVLTTASSASLEVIARELPLGVVCAANNQIENYSVLGGKGIAAQIGERTSTGLWSFNQAVLSELINDLKYRNGLIDNSRGVLDLKGSRRILSAITETKFLG